MDRVQPVLPLALSDIRVAPDGVPLAQIEALPAPQSFRKASPLRLVVDRGHTEMQVHKNTNLDP